MLNYGAASQQYFEFMTYALANRSLTNADKTIQQIPQANAEAVCCQFKYPPIFNEWNTLLRIEPCGGR